jgi:putative transposase
MELITVASSGNVMITNAAVSPGGRLFGNFPRWTDVPTPSVGEARYLLRPPLGQERVRLLPDGRVLVELKRAWADGTSHLLFEPLEFLEKLAALTPRPRVNLILYHGVLAPHARWRSQVVPEPAGDPLTPGAMSRGAGVPAANDLRGPRRPGRSWRWPDLMRRAFFNWANRRMLSLGEPPATAGA